MQRYRVNLDNVEWGREVVQFAVVTIPDSDPIAKAVKKQEKNGFPHLLPFNGACAGVLYRMACAPKHIEHDDCSGLIVATRRSAIALRKLLGGRGWGWEECTGRFYHTPDGNVFRMVDSAGDEW
jgi:hypothetical protein